MGTKERKQRELEQRKELIIEKSKELFFLKGFSKVTIQDICDTIEYGKSAVYNLFESKEEIYGHVYIEAVKILADLTNEIDVDNADAANTFAITTEQIYKFYKEYTPYYKALFFFDSNHMACEQIPEEILKRKYAEKERAMQPVRFLLNKGINKGVLKPIDVDQVINTYFASLLGIINSFVVENPKNELDLLAAMMQNHAEIYDKGLMI